MSDDALFVVKTEGPTMGKGVAVVSDPISHLGEVLDRIGPNDVVTVALDHHCDWGPEDYTYSPAGARACKDPRCGKVQYG